MQAENISSILSDRANKLQVFWSERARMQRIATLLGEARLGASAIARCLPALLVTLDWFGAPRNLVPSLPAQGAGFTVEDLRTLLADIGFRSDYLPRGKRDNLMESLPVGTLAITGEQCMLYLGRLDNKDWWHDGVSPVEGWQPSNDTELLMIQRKAGFLPIDAPQPDWFGRLMAKAQSELLGIGLISLVTNLLALSVSLFTMTVYNSVIPSGATGTLTTLGLGAIVAIICGWGLRLGRATLLARMGAWAGTSIGTAAFRKTLGLPLEYSSRLGLNNNLNRMRSLEGVRQYLSGAGGVALVDYPFVLVFIVVIALLGGWIVFVPIIGLLLFWLAAWLVQPYVQRKSVHASRVGNRLLEEYSSGIQRLRSLQGISGNHHWLRRMRDMSSQAAKANRDLALAQALVQSIGQALGMFTVLGTMAAGIALVLSQGMTAGGLIATMMLVWHVTTPAQQFFSLSLRISQIKESRLQLERLMQSAGEAQHPQMYSPVEPLSPRIAVDHLYYRYTAEQEPALNGISFELQPGQRVVVVGPNGAGKSTLLQCLSGVRMPQSGRLVLDGRDIRQFDPADYRVWVGFHAQTLQNLPLPVRDFLRLSHPSASDERIIACFARVAGETWWSLLGCTSEEAALSLQLDPWREDPDALRIRHVVGMVEAVLDDPPLLLLDDPLRDGDPVLDGMFKRLLDSLRGISTVVIATHRADLIETADLIVILDQGKLIHVGPVAPQSQIPAAQDSLKGPVHA
jgi:ABC-type bacteriocin/lantibiotic exporter with double-glycine peptidase domain